MLLVALYHLRFGVAQHGGAVGILLFFVISGYLITRLLLREAAETERIHLGLFYARRALRLLPALFVVLAALPLLLVLLAPERISEWWANTWPVLTYTANMPVAQDLYILSHAWTLAVEEHFYVLWPLLLTLLLRWNRPRLFSIVGVLALVGFVWRLTRVASNSDGFSIYVGTDTNAFALLIGCWLGIGCHLKRLPRVSKGTAIVAVLILIAIAFIPYEPWQDPTSMVLGGPIVVLASLAILGGDRISMHRTGWLQWFGARSYGLYLWHGLLVEITGVDATPFTRLAVFAAAVVAAEMSWRFVEVPALAYKAKFVPIPVRRNADSGSRPVTPLIEAPVTMAV